MPFKRVWDSSCPRIYDSWESDGFSLDIQDLPPEDDQEALRLMIEQIFTDELLCIELSYLDDPISIRDVVEVWIQCLKERLSLACYAEKDGQRKLVGVNCIYLKYRDENNTANKPRGRAWSIELEIKKYIEDKVDPFQFLGMDTFMCSVGLVVEREYRGMKLGARILQARNPLGLAIGIKGTSTLFTGPASQKSAERAGFKTVFEVTFDELADAGIHVNRNSKVLKLMAKKFE